MAVREVSPGDAVKTYRYLRIGMIGAVALLVFSTGYEIDHAKNVVTGTDPCVQRSISAYYYTPVSPIFVGCMFLVGLALIVYKGHYVWEDLFLNVAGMLAPVVALVPTTAVGDCFSIAPDRDPLTSGGSLAPWVVANANNNIFALLVVGVVGFVFAFAYWYRHRDNPVIVPPGTLWLLIWVFGVLVIGWWLWRYQAHFFFQHAHGTSANLMFFFLWLAIWVNIGKHQSKLTGLWKQAYVVLQYLIISPVVVSLLAFLVFHLHTFNVLATWEIVVLLVYGILKAINNWWRPWVEGYLAVWMLMIIGVPVSLLFEAHQVFALEAWAITAFVLYWGLQTWENWNEGVCGSRPLSDGATKRLARSAS